ncbi:MAG: MIP/aquaporin family protein [Burkholderiales bacterium]|nr:MIP/aquaporin family protein [Burkholderiales bacterium]
MQTFAKFLSEAIGTALLLAIVVGSGVMGESLAAGNAAVALLANSVATGAGLIVLIWMFGPVSGAHFNPAVSLVFALRGELPWRELPGYLAMQVAGAIAGVLLAHAMFDLALVQHGVKVRAGAAQVLSESIATFGLVLVILGVLKQRADSIAVAVGLYITAAYWFTASTSFANPAVTLARSFTTTFAGIRMEDVMPFVIGQLTGALLAWQVARLLFGTASRK